MSAGLVPSRVDAGVKAGLLDLVDHAVGAGWSLRRACATLGVDHVRVLRWAARAVDGLAGGPDGRLQALADARPGPAPGEALHGLLDWEKAAIVKVAGDWGEIDRSHRKLAHRASRLQVVHMSESSVLRVLVEAGIHLPAPGPRERRPPRAWPDWAELVPGVIFIYDFTHFTASTCCAVAVMDVVSRYWLATVVSHEESSTQVEVAFSRALVADGKEHLLDQQLLAELSSGVVPDRNDVGDDLPVLLAISDNGPQMTSRATAAFMASVRIGQHFGRPGTPNESSRHGARCRGCSRSVSPCRSPNPPYRSLGNGLSTVLPPGYAALAQGLGIVLPR